MNKKFNAVKSGAYARHILLPGDDPAELDEFKSAFFADFQPRGFVQEMPAADIVANRWLRRRARLLTSVGIWRHPYGRLLADARVGSEIELFDLVGEYNAKKHKKLDRMAESLASIAQTARGWKDLPDNIDTLERLAENVVDACLKIAGTLERLEKAIDQEREFFREYSPKEMQKQIKLENASDAQYDKRRARLLIEQEAQAIREKLQQEQPAIDSRPEDAAPSDQKSTPKALLDDPARDEDNKEVDLDADDEEVEVKPRDDTNDTTEDDPFVNFIKYGRATRRMISRRTTKKVELKSRNDTNGTTEDDPDDDWDR
jgi:hypothetical protein